MSDQRAPSHIQRLLTMRICVLKEAAAIQGTTISSNKR